MDVECRKWFIEKLKKCMVFLKSLELYEVVVVFW